MKAGHQRASCRALDLDRMDVQGHIDRAERGAESEQRRAEQQRCAGKREPRQDDGEAKPADKDDRLAAVSRAQDACQEHRHNGPNPEAQQKQAEDTIINR